MWALKEPRGPGVVVHGCMMKHVSWSTSPCYKSPSVAHPGVGGPVTDECQNEGIAYQNILLRPAMQTSVVAFEKLKLIYLTDIQKWGCKAGRTSELFGGDFEKDVRIEKRVSPGRKVESRVQ